MAKNKQSRTNSKKKVPESTKTTHARKKPAFTLNYSRTKSRAQKRVYTSERKAASVKASQQNDARALYVFGDADYSALVENAPNGIYYVHSNNVRFFEQSLMTPTFQSAETELRKSFDPLFVKWENLLSDCINQLGNPNDPNDLYNSSTIDDFINNFKQAIALPHNTAQQALDLKAYVAPTSGTTAPVMKKSLRDKITKAAIEGLSGIDNPDDLDKFIARFQEEVTSQNGIVMQGIVDGMSENTLQEVTDALTNITPDIIREAMIHPKEGTQLTQAQKINIADNIRQGVRRAIQKGIAPESSNSQLQVQWKKQYTDLTSMEKLASDMVTDVQRLCTAGAYTTEIADNLTQSINRFSTSAQSLQSKIGFLYEIAVNDVLVEMDGVEVATYLGGDQDTRNLVTDLKVKLEGWPKEIGLSLKTTLNGFIKPNIVIDNTVMSKQMRATIDSLYTNKTGVKALRAIEYMISSAAVFNAQGINTPVLDNTLVGQIRQYAAQFAAVAALLGKLFISENSNNVTASEINAKAIPYLLVVNNKIYKSRDVLEAAYSMIKQNQGYSKGVGLAEFGVKDNNTSDGMLRSVKPNISLIKQMINTKKTVSAYHKQSENKGNRSGSSIEQDAFFDMYNECVNYMQQLQVGSADQMWTILSATSGIYMNNLDVLLNSRQS